MVLLTILAIGLLSLSTISLRSSTREDDMAKAKANARMALMMAIGELQKQAGPDQRVTGTADLAGAADGSRIGAGTPPANNAPIGGSGTKGLTSVQPGTRYWTGVWNNTNTTNPGNTIYTTPPRPAFRKWLVSGNQGPINGTTGITPDANSMAVGGDGKVADAEKAVVVVGKGTIGDATGDSLDRFVSAPIVNFGTASSLAKHPEGRHAWWVGDEGVKAKINMPGYKDGNELTYQELSARWRGWDSVAGFDKYPTPGSGNIANLGKVVTLPEAELFDDSLGGNGGGASVIGRAFHSATPDSFGVLSDTLQGGLRLDLTAYLQGTLPGSSPISEPNGIAANNNIIPASVAPRIVGPKWSRLKEFADLGKTLGSSGTLTVKAAANDRDYAIGPVITDFRLLLGAKLVGTGGSQYKVQACAKIAISLANPYPYPLQWSGLDVEIFNATKNTRRPSCVYDAPGAPPFLPAYNSGPGALTNTLFRIPGETLAPGEAKAYTMRAPVLRPVGNTSTMTTNLGELVSSGASNFENCVIMDNSAAINFDTQPSIFLDVREDATTSQLNVELRPTGSTSIVRRLERFELDNANYEGTRFQVTKDIAAQLTKPFGLQYYGFQISQPGFKYETILPSAGDLGLRSSTVRTFADFNLQAARYRKPIISYNPPPYFMQIANNRGSLPTTPPGGQTGDTFTRNLAASPMPWGRSTTDSRRAVLFSPPKTLVSLAQFQQADLTADDYSVSVAHQPGNAVGNSYASPFVQRRLAVYPRADITITDFNSAELVPLGPNNPSTQRNYYDLSYLLNAVLWDTYFFSTIENGSQPLNPSMVKINASDTSSDLKEGARSAAHLLVDGSQNVNCTDKDAWKALLASSKHLQHKSDTGSSDEAIFPRSLEQTDPAKVPPTGIKEDSYAGFRKLTDDQIDLLATELVKQVRLRGPFVSVSQFVNRSLIALSVANAQFGRSGPLQAAIDAAGININPEGTKHGFGSGFSIAADKLNFQRDGSSPMADLNGTRATGQSPIGGAEWPPRSFDLNPGSVASILADKTMLTDTRLRTEQGFRSTGMPGWLTQADVLQVIGPFLSARSDTFRIRAYGESTDPSTGTPVARAWCEAIVQRMPDYVDGNDPAYERPAALRSSVNKAFGRRFAMVSFKWLSPNEI